MYRREEPIPTVFSLHYKHKDKALNMSVLYFEQTHFCTKHVRLVRFNLLLRFTLGFSLFIILLYVQLTGLLMSFWQEFIILLLYVHDSHNSAQEQWIMIAKMQRHWFILSPGKLLKYIFFTSQYITATTEKSRLNFCKRSKRREFCGKFCTS